MASKFEILAKRIQDDQQSQYPVEPSMEWLVAMLGDLHDIEMEHGESVASEAIYDRIRNVYDDDADAEGVFDRFWKRDASTLKPGEYDPETGEYDPRESV